MCARTFLVILPRITSFMMLKWLYFFWQDLFQNCFVERKYHTAKYAKSTVQSGREVGAERLLLFLRWQRVLKSTNMAAWLVGEIYEGFTPARTGFFLMATCAFFKTRLFQVNFHVILQVFFFSRSSLSTFFRCIEHALVLTELLFYGTVAMLLKGEAKPIMSVVRLRPLNCSSHWTKYSAAASLE